MEQPGNILRLYFAPYVLKLIGFQKGSQVGEYRNVLSLRQSICHAFISCCDQQRFVSREVGQNLHDKRVWKIGSGFPCFEGESPSKYLSNTVWA